MFYMDHGEFCRMEMTVAMDNCHQWDHEQWSQ